MKPFGLIAAALVVAVSALMPASEAVAQPLPTPPAQLQDAYDVVIAGAGTGAFGAAVQAARMGCSVLVTEETDWIGGQMLAAAVSSMDEAGPAIRERGIYREFVAAVEAHYAPMGELATTRYSARSNVAFESRVGRMILYDMLAQAKGEKPLDVSLLTTVTKVTKQGNAVTGVEVQVQDRKKSIACKVLIDATEYGDVLPLTGARYRIGNCLSDGVIDPARHIQDNTWTAVIKQYPNGVPAELTFTAPPPGYTPALDKSFKRTLSNEGDKKVKGQPFPWVPFLRYRGMPDSSRPVTPDDGGVPTRTHMNFNNDVPTTIGDLQDPALREAKGREMRLKTLHLLYYVQQVLGRKDWSVANDEGFDSPYNVAQIDRWLADQPELKPYRPILLHFSTIPYARESRRLVGLHTLTSVDVDRQRGAKQFPDSIALGDYPTDLHGSKQPEFMEQDLDPAELVVSKFGAGHRGPFSVPMRSLIPETVDGLLAAEKNISQSRMANGATRLQPSSMLIGQAAGAVAALAVRHGVRPRDLDPVLVQDALLEAEGAIALQSVGDVNRDGPNWSVVQLVLAHGAFRADKGKFRPRDPLTADEMTAALAALFPGAPAAPAPAGVTPAAFVDAVRARLAASKEPFDFAPGDVRWGSTDQSLNRVDAAQFVARFLQQRAAHRLKGGATVSDAGATLVRHACRAV